MTGNSYRSVRLGRRALVVFSLILALGVSACAPQVFTPTELSGVVERVRNDSLVVDGTPVRYTSETAFEDEVEVGDTVLLIVSEAENGELVASEVSVLQQAGNANDNAVDNNNAVDNSNDNTADNVNDNVGDVNDNGNLNVNENGGDFNENGGNFNDNGDDDSNDNSGNVNDNGYVDSSNDNGGGDDYDDDDDDDGDNNNSGSDDDYDD